MNTKKKTVFQKYSAEDKATVEQEIEAFKKVRETNDAQQIKGAMDSFSQKVYEVFGKLYQSQQGGANPNGTYQDPNANGQNAGYSADGASDADYDVH